MLSMGTYYKSSQWRGKRQVYRSTDPDEPKHEAGKMIRFLVGIILIFATVCLFSIFAK